MKILLSVLVLTVIVVGFVFWSMNDEASNLNYPVSTEQSTEKVNEEKLEPSTIEGDSVTTLNLSGQGLTKVSADIFTQVKLTELDLSNNELTGSLPAEIRQLQNLKVLDLSDNRFTGVPAEVGQLKLLEELDLSNNQLTGLPNELGNLANLKLLNLSGNKYSEADLANIRKNLPTTTTITVN